MLDFALDTTRQAGGLLRGSFQRQHTVRSKTTAIDLVTEMDVASEQLIVDAIRAQYPDHAVLSEEGLGDLDRVLDGVSSLWLVDPLDGTVNYAHGFPTWGVTLAYVEQGQVVVGVTYDPLLDEIYWAERGQGAWLNGQRMWVSSVSRLGESLVATGFAYGRASLEDNNLTEFGAVMPRVQGVRRAGSAILDLAYVAAGRLDAYWEMHLQPWDWAAGSLLVREAGGTVTDRSGKPWDLGKSEVVASNGLLHGELLTTMRRAGRIESHRRRF
jgi:myo-inositol-1(or 4)-monophosphatase